MTIIETLCIVIGVVSLTGLIIVVTVVRRTLNNLTTAIFNMNKALDNMIEWLKD
jgi:hypothetical protein